MPGVQLQYPAQGLVRRTHRRHVVVLELLVVGHVLPGVHQRLRATQCLGHTL